MATISTLADKFKCLKLSFAFQFLSDGKEYLVAAYYKYNRASCTPIFVGWNLTDQTEWIIKDALEAGGESYPVQYTADYLTNNRLATVNYMRYIEIDPATGTVAFSHDLPSATSIGTTMCQGLSGHVVICNGTSPANFHMAWCDPGGANWDSHQLTTLPGSYFLRRPCSMVATDTKTYVYGCNELNSCLDYVVAVEIASKTETRIEFPGADGTSKSKLYQGSDGKLYVQVSYAGAGWYTLDGVAAPTPSAAPPGYYHKHYTDETIFNKWFTSETIVVDKTNIIANNEGVVSVSYSGETKPVSGVDLYATVCEILSKPHPDGYSLGMGESYGPVYSVIGSTVTLLGYDNRNSYGDIWSPNHGYWWRIGYDRKVSPFSPLPAVFTTIPLMSDAEIAASGNPGRKVPDPALGLTGSDDHFLFPIVDAVDKKLYFSVRSRPRMIWYDPVADDWDQLVLTNAGKVFDSDIMHITSIRGGHFIAISSRDQDTGLLTLNVAPSTAWEADDLITGQTSGAMLRVVAKLTDLTYTVKGWNGVNFTLGEVLTNGTYTADQGTGYPTLVGYGDWIGRLYLFNVLDQAVQKVLTITTANAEPTLVDIGILVEVGPSLTDNGHVIAVRGNLASDSKAWRINTHAIMPSAVVWGQDIAGKAFNLAATGTNEYCYLEVASDGLVYLMVGTDLKSIDPADGTVSAAVSISGGSIPAGSKLRWIGDTLYAYGADANLYPIAGVV